MASEGWESLVFVDVVTDAVAEGQEGYTAGPSSSSGVHFSWCWDSSPTD